MELTGLKKCLIEAGKDYLYTNCKESPAIDGLLDGAKQFQVQGKLLIVNQTFVKTKESKGGDALRKLFVTKLDIFIQAVASGTQPRIKVSHFLYAECFQGTSFQTIEEFKKGATFDQTIDAFNRILKVVHKLSV